jgi:heat shock protein HslJ
LACCVVFVVMAAVFGVAIANEGFPFDRDLVLDAAPMRGSKRLPIIAIAANGAASMQLWCVTVQGKADVGADTIAIVPAAAQRGQCGPDSIAKDESLLTAITQATGWQRRGEVIELVGPTTLRFRLMTN